MPIPSTQDFPVITSEDSKRPGINAGKLFSSVLRRSRYQSFLGSQTHGGELVHSAAVDWNIEIGSFDVPSEFRPVHGITPAISILSDERDSKTDRASYKPDDLTDSREGETGEGETSDSICVKLLRRHPCSQAGLVAIRQRFYHESARWRQISHPNLVPIHDVSDAPIRGGISFSVVTPWIPNGDITAYLQEHQGANRLNLLVQAACGLEHLHSSGIIHSSINPGNILVNDDGRACLGDFGIAQIATTVPGGTISRKPDACRYMPPELLDEGYPRRSYSEAGDIYSLAMTAFEVLTDIIPYEEVCEKTIPACIRNGKRPDRPAENQWLTDPLWEMLEDCWKKDPELRWEARCMGRRFSNPETAQVRDMPCVGAALRPVGFAVELNKLRADDCPKYLARCLQFTLKERQTYEQWILKLKPKIEEVKGVLEVFDKVLGYCSFDPLIPRRFGQLCSDAGHLPVSYTIPRDQISTVGEHAIASGGFGDVWEGSYGGRRVAIKALRIYKEEDTRNVKRAFYEEVTMWKQLSHPNIVPFLGVTDTPAPFSMVSEWMPNGDVRHYVKKHPEVDRLQLLLDICHGLQVLHTHNIVHGDLKGANILVNSSGWACLTDFGLSSIASFSCTETSAHGPRCSMRWTAPELLHLAESKPSPPTKESDIYALAMVTIEVFTGLIPFESCRAEPTVMLKIINGDRPTQPVGAAELGLTDGLWRLIRCAWAEDAQKRPPVGTIIEFLLQEP